MCTPQIHLKLDTALYAIKDREKPNFITPPREPYSKGVGFHSVSLGARVYGGCVRFIRGANISVLSVQPNLRWRACSFLQFRPKLRLPPHTPMWRQEIYPFRATSPFPTVFPETQTQRCACPSFHASNLPSRCSFRLREQL